ncbi:MAG: endo alpha-1,4 polygalactosaminidase [Gammaproteobacteria bacterium]|nr:endo alpha-1,4 polygalactosaminidase [Gammaproteobacteria bacterium]
MKRCFLRHSKIVISALMIVALTYTPATYAYQKEALAVYYGKKIPPVLKRYSQIVVQPGYDPTFDPKKYDTPERQVFAYTSLGEVSSFTFNGKSINKAWIVGQNDAWNTSVMDQANPQWRQFFLDNVITVLWNQGYRGFYLDTLDSYRIGVTDTLKLKQQEQGLIDTIKAIKKKYPDAKLILNRGFELIPAIHPLVTRMTVESVFSGWDNAKQKYYTVKPQDRAWAIDAIKKVQAFKIPVTIIDYLPPNEEEKYLEIENKITEINCDPWVTDSQLIDFYLPQHISAMPRKVMVFYRASVDNAYERLGSAAVRHLATPLNYLGYDVEIQNINKPLPRYVSKKKYAGVVMAIGGILLGREQELYDFYLQQLRNHMPLVILGDFGFMVNNTQLKPFGLTFPVLTHKPQNFHVIYQSPVIGYELQPLITRRSFIPLQLDPKMGKSLFTIEDQVGLKTNLAAVTSWGGYYLGSSYLPEVTFQGSRWAINPFEFFKQVLRLPDTPIPDVTTENGRRLMFTHIDGDGFANRGEWPDAHYVGVIMRKDILKRYQLPATVSIIQGEIASNGLHPKESKKLERIARNIFALPYVELASHTYSHPFNWYAAEHYKGKGPNPYILPLTGYHFNLKTEIYGSIDYINRKLAPPGKKAKVFLWCGEGDAPIEALQYAEELGLRNMNPGRIITRYNPSLTRVSALGMNEGPYYQVFAPIGSDQEVQGIASERFFYLLVNLIHAFKLTEEPIRLKPIDVYLHFYTLAQKGGIKALKTVYEWVLKQPILPIYGSEYADKVIDFNQLMISKQNGGWLILTHDDLREMRVPTTMGYPDLINSRHVIGYNDYQNNHYVHLAPGGESFLKLTSKPPETPYLVNANARITRFSQYNKNINLTFAGHLPLQFDLANATQCVVIAGKKRLKASESPEKNQRYILAEKNAQVSVQCR